ncbi:ATP-dependent RNA helicase RhlE domain protein, partial [Vibrio parahaemolyticus V-223/04]|jgi:U3 small nucleolar ribonucleoprotein protein IMP4
MFFL